MTSTISTKRAHSIFRYISSACAPCDQSRTGWTIGGGVEWAFAPGWSAFAEFDYYDFGTKNLLVTTDIFTPGGDTFRVDVKQQIETVKVGLNYHLDADAAPLTTPVPVKGLAYKAPPVAPAPVNWTSCYLGPHIGWGWGQVGFREREFGADATPTDVSPGLSNNGGMLGGQLGCNYQFAGNWVAGIEGSASATDLNGTGHDPFFGGIGEDVLKVKTEWIASVTGRLGLAAWIPQSLIYAKGGVAWAHDVYDLNQAGSFFISTPCSPCSETRAGWTIGGGIEWAFAANWSAFAEFDHYDFGTNRLLTSGCTMRPQQSDAKFAGRRSSAFQLGALAASA
jgi:outer membrane immunogenic protein